MADKVITYTTAGPCTCCGATCYLTIPPPVGATPYANLTDATAAIADRTASCIAFADGSGTLNTFTASAGTNSISMVANGNPFPGINALFHGWFAMDISAAATLTYTFSLGTGTVTGAQIDVYDDTGTLVDTDSGATSPLSVSVGSAGIYEVRVILVSDVLLGDDTFNCDVSCDEDATVCSIRAAYGGTPDYLICT